MKHFQRKFYIILIGLIFICPCNGSAQDPSPDTFELGEVVVTAKASSSDQIFSVTTITAEEIKAANARTLDEALRLVPGMQIRTAGQGVPRIDFRGMRTRQLNVLINGVPISSPYNNQFDPSLISSENIARIKVTRGPSSSLYGSGGNAGVINIITKKAVKGFHGSIGFEGGQHDEYLSRGSLSYSDNKFNIYASGSMFDAENFPLPGDFEDTALQTGDYRVNTDKERLAFYTNAIYSPSTATQLALTIDIKQGEYGIPPETVSDNFTNKKPNDLSKLNYRRMDDKDGLSVQLAFQHEVTPSLMIRGWGYVNTLEETENDFDDISYTTQSSNAYRDERDTGQQGANIQIAYDMGNSGTLTGAIIAKRGDYESTYQDDPEADGSISYTDVNTDNYSAALEYAILPTDAIALVMGYGFHQQNRSEANDENDHSFFLGLNYDVRENSKIKASIARKVRFPSLRELYDNKSGNTDLTAENTTHYQLGYQQHLAELDSAFEVTGFYIDADDFIEKDESTEKMANFESYRFQGLEIALTSNAIEKLRLKMAYTYLDAENQSPDQPFDVLEHRPENKFSAEATYGFESGLTVYAAYLYVDERYHFDKKLEEKGVLNSYHLVSLKLSQKLMNDMMALYIGARNLFDEEYEESYALVREGRRIYGGIEYRF